ncbi:ImuA family protein [Albibacterium profundi]|uniref:Error-prone repair protein ImuA n=1 Tax=Albibacterium profundi TaxID=3134906 RepID=A0ABV5CHI7_9SPHI
MKKGLIDKLKRDILLWQGYKPQSNHTEEKIGLGGLESAFPNGVFPKGAIHEFICFQPESSAASNGFVAALLSVLMKQNEVCLWVSTSRKLFPIALRMFDVKPEQIIFIDVKTEKEALWVTEEALKCEGLTAVVAEINNLNLIESRRLQLAVEESGVTGFIIRKSVHKAITTGAAARWKVIPLPSETEAGMPGIGFPRWSIELIKVRNGNPGNWAFDWMGDKLVEVLSHKQEKETSWFDLNVKLFG